VRRVAGLWPDSQTAGHSSTVLFFDIYNESSPSGENIWLRFLKKQNAEVLQPDKCQRVRVGGTCFVFEIYFYFYFIYFIAFDFLVYYVVLSCVPYCEYYSGLPNYLYRVHCCSIYP